MCVRLEKNNLGLHMRGSNEMLLKGVKKVGIVKTENLIEKEDFKKNSQNEFKNKWHEKRMYGQFVREMSQEIDKYLSWKWLVQSDLKVKTEATIWAAKEQALRTNYTKNKTDKTSENPLCSMCGERGETVQHVICECKKLAQREYKWYEHCPEGAVEDDDVKLIWDINMECDNVIEARRPDLILVDKKEKLCVIIDVAISSNCRICDKVIEKIEKY